MYNSVRSPRISIVRSPVRYLLPIIVLASVAVAGCRRVKTADLEARIVALEAKVQAQEQRIRLLGSAAMLSQRSVFDSPLRRFFDAPEFWERIFVDYGACYYECRDRYQAAMDLCDSTDVECQGQAARELVTCHARCEAQGQRSP
jgi:hypothetical protein